MMNYFYLGTSADAFMAFNEVLNTWKCLACQKDFNVKYNAKRHIETMHFVNKPEQCLESTYDSSHCKVSCSKVQRYSRVQNKRAGTFINFQAFFQGACSYLAQYFLSILIFLTKPT